MTTVGFTGTRNGMTFEQKETVLALLGTGNVLRAIHGDCIGADADFDAICKSLGIPRFQRPCTFENMRAHTDATPLAAPKPPMARNRDIVADADWMIACPPNYKRIHKGSGTWATIGFSEKAGCRIVVVFPDGTRGDLEANRPLTAPGSTLG